MAEEHIQQRIFDDPTVINGAWADPADVPRQWLFAVREMPIHIDEQQTQKNLSLDLLLVDEQAVPTLVETKLSSNIEIRRTIVGQILEYATFARSWDIHNLRWDYEHPDSAYINIKVIAPIFDPDVFWSKLRKNLDDGRMVLVLAADEFPTETGEVIKFLHERTDTNLEVLAYAPEGFAGLAAHQRQERSRLASQLHPRHVAGNSDHNLSISTKAEQGVTEYIFTKDASVDAIEEMELVPLSILRCYGHPQGVMTPEHLSSLLDKEAQINLHQILSVAHHAGACFKIRSQSLIICVDTSAWSSLINIGWLDPPESSKNSWGQAGTFTFGYAGDTFTWSRLPGERLYTILEQFAVNIASIGQHTPRWKNSVLTRAHSVPYHHGVAHIDELCEYLLETISAIRQLSPEEPNGTRPALEPVPAPPTVPGQQGLREALLEALREANSQEESTER